MVKQLSLAKQEELFTKECKVINLLYEYSGYTGQEKWAIITELTEKELQAKYPNVIHRYTPFILLSMAQGEVIKEYQNNEAKERMRNLRFGCPFGIEDGDFEEHHPEILNYEDVIEKVIREDENARLKMAINVLTEIQKKRIVKYFFEGKTFQEIANEECVKLSSVEQSVYLAQKKLKKFLKNTCNFTSPSSNK